MDNSDDVEHLFSWLQTADLRYREFAGAREITDSVIVARHRRANNTPVPQDAPEPPLRHDAQVAGEYPGDPLPDKGETRVEALPEPRHEPRRVSREETVAARVEERPAPPLTRPAFPSAAPRPATPRAAGGGLLGGAYRASGADNHDDSPGASREAPSPPGSRHRNVHSLDAVFGRLAGGRSRVPDPRDRMRHSPAFNPRAGRPR